jgi:hypothetical protein
MRESRMPKQAEAGREVGWRGSTVRTDVAQYPFTAYRGSHRLPSVDWA